MIFPDITFEKWIEKYPELADSTVDSKINLCVHCKNTITPKIPFIKKGYVGLMSNECHHCQYKSWSYISITTSKKEYDSWSSII